MNSKTRFLAGGLAILIVAALFPVLLQSTIQKSRPQPQTSRADNPQMQKGLALESLSNMPLAFAKNQGQWDDQVRFQANTGAVTMWLTQHEMYYQLTRKIPRAASSTEDLGTSPLAADLQDREEFDQEPENIETMAIRTSFIGANPDPKVVGEGLMEHTCNYLTGNDPANWHTDVPNYRAVCLKEIYSGIDLKYYGNGSQLEYDFIVSPGADPSQIHIAYEGVNSMSVNEIGELVIETDWTTITEQKPKIYQIIDGEQKQIAGRYDLVSTKTFGFQLEEEYDPHRPLIIDPELDYGAILGGDGHDQGYGIALDAAGNAYVTGQTASTDFPLHNPYQGNADDWDVFVTKLNSAGDGLVYSTYLGGDDNDYGRAIAVDLYTRNAYITGWTHSTNFPTTLGAFQPNKFDYSDVFVTKLDYYGNTLVYSTYLGAEGYEGGYGIAVDFSGNAYVAGITGSANFPTTPGAFQENQPGHHFNNGFVTKFAIDGNSLVYSTYLGGTLENTEARGIAVDGYGRAYVTGGTWSDNFPIKNPYQASRAGTGDAFMTKFGRNGDTLIYSTYLGGESTEIGHAIAVDEVHCAFITGYTFSTGFPTTPDPFPGPYQPTYAGGCDAFVARLSTDLWPDNNVLWYSTYLGGDGSDIGCGIAVDENRQAYVTGKTGSSDFPTEPHGPNPQGNSDAFVTKLSIDGAALDYSHYLGGDAVDEGQAIAVEVCGGGNAYVTGYTSSTDFPADTSFGSDPSGQDVFVVKLKVTGRRDIPCLCGPKGDINNDNSGDPLDVAYLVDFVYRSIDNRVYDVCWNCPYDLGDLDCSGGAPDPLDVTYLVNYVYLSLDDICDGCG